VFGDHAGFDPASRALLAALGAVAVGLGPVSVHADDAVTLVVNELDRRMTPPRPPG
jgi:tRNA pseudouridine-54 N-methylase